MPIKKLVRENATLVVGISLPFVVVILFLLATYIPRWFVAAPQHDFLFAQWRGIYGQPASREFEVDAAGKIRVRLFLEGSETSTDRPRLYRYDHVTGEVREIRIPTVPEDAESGDLVEIPGLSNEIIGESRIAPDGYEFLERRDGRGGGLLISLSYRRRDFGLAIAKDGAVVEVPTSKNLSQYNFRFLGWIVKPQSG